MYGKIFASMFDGSLYGNWKAIVTFQQLIVLSDREGFVDMTPQAISARTSIPLDIVTEGLHALEQPDPHSRSPDLDGRRIERVDERRPWGWKIVNYSRYRTMVSRDDKRQADRERIAAKRAAERGLSRVNDESATCRKVSQVSQTVADVAHADAEADALRISRPLARTPASAFHQEVIEAYHAELPSLPSVKVWTPKRRQWLDARIRENLARGKPADTIEYWRSFFASVAASDFLCGRAKDGFRANLEWLIDASNFAKTIEGHYVNRGKGAPHAR